MYTLSKNQLASALFSVVVLLVGADLISDLTSGADLFHVATEGSGAFVALIGVALFYQNHRLEMKEAATWRAQAEELLAGVGNAIEDQFHQWELTAAEREVALLLLKGLSFKEIASVRGNSERTGRQQARSVYSKAKVAGRAELSAWFIEDLLPPQPSGPQG